MKLIPSHMICVDVLAESRMIPANHMTLAGPMSPPDVQRESHMTRIGAITSHMTVREEKVLNQHRTRTTNDTSRIAAAVDTDISGTLLQREKTGR